MQREQKTNKQRRCVELREIKSMSDKNQQRNGKAIIQMNLRPLFSVVTRYRRCTKDYGNKPFADCASITP